MKPGGSFAFAPLAGVPIIGMPIEAGEPGPHKSRLENDNEASLKAVPWFH